VVAHFLATRKHRRRKKPKRLAGGKGYSTQSIRTWLKQQHIEAVLPHKENERARHDPAVVFDQDTYRQRHGIEQCVGWMKEYRRIGTRFEKLAVHYHGMLQLAMIRRYLKMLFSDRVGHVALPHPERMKTEAARR
jgi:transposase